MNTKTKHHLTTLQFSLAILFSALSAFGAEQPRQVVLLVPGIQLKLKSSTEVWGTWQASSEKEPGWSGLIGRLTTSGYRYGGVVQPRGATIQLPQCLDQAHTSGAPEQATLFVLEFSQGAGVDGLAYKTLELSCTLRELQRYTGRKQMSLVAYSAGGLVARTYLQSALPEVPFRHDVDRLITICSPHLGSAAAEHWGDWLGTRATSLQTRAELVRRLNCELELPADVLFASIVVRGVGIGITGTRGTGRDYWHLLNTSQLARLPLNYREGGDQIVHVCSQNLRLAECARRYEQATSRPVLTYLARIQDPTPDDRSFLETHVHDVAVGHAATTELIVQALDPSQATWRECDGPQLARWLARHAQQTAMALTERGAANRHPLSEVHSVTVDRIEIAGQDGDCWHFRFRGQAAARGRITRVATARTEVLGEFQLTLDRFGQVCACRESILAAVDD